MLSQPAADQPVAAVDIRAFGWETEVRAVTSARNDDPLALAKGVLLGVLLCAPFWLTVVWVLV